MLYLYLIIYAKSGIFIPRPLPLVENKILMINPDTTGGSNFGVVADPGIDLHETLYTPPATVTLSEQNPGPYKAGYSYQENRTRFNSGGLGTGDWLGSAVGFVGGLVSDAIGQHRYKKNMKRQHEYREIEAENDLRRQMMMFDYAADYNSPVNQVERLRQAGLSKLAALEGGSVGGAGSQSAPSVSSPGHISPSGAAMSSPHAAIDSALGIMSGLANIRDTEASAALKEQQKMTEVSESVIRQLGITTELLKQEKLNLDNETAAISNYIQRVTQDAQVSKIKADSEYAWNAAAAMFYKISSAYQDGRLKDAQTAAAYGQALESLVELQLFDLRQQLLESQITLTDQQAANIYQLTITQLNENHYVDYLMTGGSPYVKRGSSRWYLGQQSKLDYAASRLDYEWADTKNIVGAISTIMDPIAHAIAGIHLGPGARAFSAGSSAMKQHGKPSSLGRGKH